MTFIDFLTFKKFSPHSTNAFSISACCLTIVVKVDLGILRHSAKTFYEPMFLCNSLKMLSFFTQRKIFSFSTILAKIQK